MKIGIITIPDITNYGNRLQNYALSYILKKYFGCFVVSLASYKEKPFENKTVTLAIKNFVIRQLCIFPKFVESYFGCNMTRWTNFYKWDKKYILTKNFYEYSCLPKDLNAKFDMFFAGSDQIWNYKLSGMKYEDYFLKFAECKKRVAISASFGVEYIPDDLKSIYKENLSFFEHLSVREYTGSEIIKDLLNKEVPVLLDPTMMLTKEEWLRVSKRPRIDCSKSYVLKYYLGNESQEDRIDSWAKDNGYEVYELLNDTIPELYSAGPGEFISLISNASLVCSDSFHCIVFSILFSKPFIVYTRHGEENYMTSRLDTLLKKFGFEKRWKHLITEKDYLKCDYSIVPSLLEIEQKRFMDYLSNVLK